MMDTANSYNRPLCPEQESEAFANRQISGCGKSTRPYRYATEPQDWAERPQATFLCQTANRECSYRRRHLVFDDPTSRSASIQHKHWHGTQAMFPFDPLSTAPMARTFGGNDGQYPCAGSNVAGIIRLSFRANLSRPPPQETVVATALSFRF